MGLVVCRACAKEIHETVPTCPYCGTLQEVRNGKESDGIPDGIKGWSWGAFFLSWIWAIGNRTWIGLLALVPLVGFIMAIVLGVKGREWAWKNKEWESVEHFNRIQQKWSFWGVMIVIVIGISAALTIPAYRDYAQRQGQFGATSKFKKSIEVGSLPAGWKARILHVERFQQEGLSGGPNSFFIHGQNPIIEVVPVQCKSCYSIVVAITPPTPDAGAIPTLEAPDDRCSLRVAPADYRQLALRSFDSLQGEMSFSKPDGRIELSHGGSGALRFHTTGEQVVSFLCQRDEAHEYRFVMR